MLRTVPAGTSAEVGVDRSALGMVGSSRPATTSTASPATRAAAVAARLDETRMLPPAGMATVDLIIGADAAAGRKVQRGHALLGRRVRRAGQESGSQVVDGPEYFTLPRVHRSSSIHTFSDDPAESQPIVRNAGDRWQ
jgi:hypothetical protein